ncbi:MAG: two-component system sensor histidine kinase CreC [Pseudomonadota bacterium]
MSVFGRLAIFYFILLSVTLIFVWNVFFDEIKPSFRQISEEAMVDNANLLAELLTPLFVDGTPEFDALDAAVTRYQQRNPEAMIWSHLKSDTNMQFYITDAAGVVRYHSRDAAQVGEDYSEWRDVHRTLLGEYGARTSLRDAEDITSGEMYVAAPIRDGDTLLGVFTLIKPHQSIVAFIGDAEYRLTAAGLGLLAVLTLTGLALVIWYQRMLDQLMRFVERVRRGKKASPPMFMETGFSQLSDALQHLRTELDGKLYVENYTHTLTHELKSPLAAISAATELLQTDLPEAKRQQFMENIDAEVTRMQQIIEQLLLLAALENRESSDGERVSLAEVVDEVLTSIDARVRQKGITLEVAATALAGAHVRGDRFLLTTALSNLLTNALDFCAPGGTVQLTTAVTASGSDAPSVEIAVTNTGEPIPDYAQARLFERFFSTARPDSKRKSSGLGLCVVEQICALHSGHIGLHNTTLAGQSAVQARWVLPLSD